MDINNFKKLSNLFLKNDKSYINVKASGDCMMPFFSNGDVLVVQRRDSYLVGDVVVATHENRVIAHRVLEYDGIIYHIKGDKSIASEKLGYEDIVGVVIGVLVCGKIVSYSFPEYVVKNIVNMSLKVYQFFISSDKDYHLTAHSDEFVHLREYTNGIDIDNYKSIGDLK